MRDSTKDETRYQKLKQVYQINQSFVVFVDLFFYEKEKTFDHIQMRFLISRKSIAHRRKILIKNFIIFLEWEKNFFMFINSLIATKKNRTKIMLLMKTWKNIFVKNIKNMLVIDLIEYRILIYRIIISKVVKSMLYTIEKIIWQKKNLSFLEQVEIIMRCSLSWNVKTRFSRKSNDELKMIHAFCLLNEITIKINQFMRKIESILRDMSQFFIKYLFRANVANEF